MVLMAIPLFKFHIFKVPSSEAETIFSPSRVMATALTQLSWLVRVRSNGSPGGVRLEVKGRNQACFGFCCLACSNIA